MTTPKLAENARAILRVTSLALLMSAAGTVYAQSATPAPATTTGGGLNEEEAVELPKFEITAESGNRYQAQQALSASRIATAIVDIPQTISVIPKELMEDTKGNRMLDTAKYVTPIQESTLPFGGDRYTIRGFAVSAEFIDGTNISGADGYSMSLPPYNIERLEIIKGPNAILVPGGSPGGVMNPITKAPMAKNAITLNIDFSPYLGNDVAFDVNRVLAKDVAVRFIGAFWKTDYYIKGQVRNGYELSPSFSIQLSPAHKLTLKGDFVKNRETNLGGVPLDPSVGANQYAQIARGLPRNWQFGNEIDRRRRHTERASAELLSTLNDHVNSRLFVMVDQVRRIDVGGTSAGLTQAGGGSINPNTGLYEPGVTWNTAAYNLGTAPTLIGTVNPVTDPSTWVYTRNNGKVDLKYSEAHVKNDYAALFETRWFKSTTIAGFAANTSKVRYVSWVPAKRPDVPANNLGSITYPNYDFTAIEPGFTSANKGIDRTARQNDLQTFLYESMSVWHDRIQVSGGVSRFYGTLARTDNTGTAILNTPATINSPAYNMTSNATSFGVVVKPIKQVSLFFSRNTTGGAMPGSLNAGVTDPSTKVAVGGQKEFGIKTSFLDGKFTTSFAHFDISQKNFAVTNSEYYRLVSLGLLTEAAALPQALYLDLNSKGWEFEATYSIGKSFTILGNITDYKVRQPITNVRLRGVPDRAYGLFADYRFVNGVMKGFGINFGVDYKSDVTGENATGYTTTRTLPNGTFVPVQPSFLIDARTLYNLGFGYKFKTWSISATIVNLLNEEYILSAGSRGSVVVGTPRTWKSSISYSF